MQGIYSIHTRPQHYFFTAAIASLIFDAYYLVMKRLPSVGDVPACTIGGALTFENIIFSGILSILTAIMLAGLVRLYIIRKSVKVGAVSGSLAGAGFIFGFFTVFCTLCTIPVISIFGIAVRLGFFTTYNLLFKILSILLMILSLSILNKKLKFECKICS